MSTAAGDQTADDQTADDQAAGDQNPAPAAVPGARPRRGLPGPFLLVVLTVLLLLHGLPWWRLVLAPQWPAAVTIAGTVLAIVALIGFPFAMINGHGRRASDRWARIGDSWLGIVWVLFSWTVIGELAGLALLLTGVPTPDRQRVVAVSVLVVAIVLCCWGNYQARRVPPVRRTEITLDRLAAGLDGLTIVLIADTHYGPINRAVWSAKMVAAVNRLEPDVIVHAGDLADGSVERRRAQVAPLGTAQAGLARVYITGNHEYFSGAVQWVQHMTDLGWTVLHNKHVIVERGGARLAIAGTDDLTAAGSGIPGHRSDLPAALAGVPSGMPVVLVAHQPKEVREAAAAGVDLQLSGHTHGGQIWPFHLIVRVEQGALQGLSRSGPHTQLYTTRGVGFWGPPFRVFAPNEISLLTLRSGPRSG
jgi:predicted MPP superfamily phosphohydrolase